jgi:hypothetical protein
MVAPTLLLWLGAMACGVASCVAATGGAAMRADRVSRFAMQFVIASWVIADARKRGRGLCYDYDSFVFFLLPIIVPIYLFQTRGMRALLTLLCFAGIWLISMVPVIVVTLIREFGP